MSMVRTESRFKGRLASGIIETQPAGQVVPVEVIDEEIAAQPVGSEFGLTISERAKYDHVRHVLERIKSKAVTR